MEISFTGAPEHMATMLGFGNASWHMFNTFRKLGIDPMVNSDKANICISFTQPPEYKFGEDQYKIGYTPWESTAFMPGWKETMDQCDEIWTTSKWNKMIFENILGRQVFVYMHGIDHAYSPKKRKYNLNEPFTFLHVGEPFNRKDGQLVVDTFIKLYGNNPNFRLIMKCTGSHNLRIQEPSGFNWDTPDKFYSNIILEQKVMSSAELLSLYSSAHCFVYPSWGEGFGFNPLQAMAMGIPTICVDGWAEYANRITLPLDSIWAQSPWQEVHPGNMLQPSADQLAEHMVSVVQDYDKYSKIAFNNSFKVHEEFDWGLVTKPAIGKLKKIQKSRF